MRSKSFIAVAVALLALFAGAAVLVVLDANAKDKIAEGVRVGGVDLSGLSRSEAEARLRRDLLPPPGDRIAVHHDRKTWSMTMREAKVRADVDAMVDAAVDRSREGGLLGRVWREVTGGDEKADLPAEVTYSRAAVQHLVTRVENGTNRRARDARVDFVGGLHKVEGRSGLAVRAQRLEDEIGRALATSSSDHTFIARTRKIQPKVTTAELGDKYPSLIFVDRANFRLTLYKKLKVQKTYGIAVGQVGLETPAGMYKIENKAVNPAWHVPNSAWAGSLAGKVIPGGVPENPIRERWMGIYAGAGIHGTTDDGSIGSAASHGCIRMHIPDVIELYDQVDVGTPVYIS